MILETYQYRMDNLTITLVPQTLPDIPDVEEVDPRQSRKQFDFTFYANDSKLLKFLRGSGSKGFRSYLNRGAATVEYTADCDWPNTEEFQNLKPPVAANRAGLDVYRVTHIRDNKYSKS